MAIEYDHEFIRANPIHAICERCRRKERIHAPTLDNVLCFWCGPSRESRLRPVDPGQYQVRLLLLPKYAVRFVSEQMDLFT